MRDITSPAEGDAGRALRVAAIRGDTDAVVALLGQGVSVDAADGCGWTALMLAAKYGHADLVCLLVERGAAVDATCASATGTIRRRQR